MEKRIEKERDSLEKVIEKQEEKNHQKQNADKVSSKITNQETVYTILELADNAKKLFQTKSECVTAALKAIGKTTFTVSEAKGIVRDFLKKEVH